MTVTLERRLGAMEKRMDITGNPLEQLEHSPGYRYPRSARTAAEFQQKFDAVFAAVRARP